MRRFAATIRGNKNPLEIFGDDLKLYINATDTSTIDFTGNNVNQINDLSGNNNHLIYSGSVFTKPTGNVDSNQTHSVKLAGLNSLKISDISDFRTQEGEFIFYILDIPTPTPGITNNIRMASFSNENSNNLFLLYKMDSVTNWLRILSRISGVTNDLHSENILTGSNNQYSFSSDSINYRFVENTNLEKSIVSGTDNGNWIGDNNNLQSLFVGAYKFDNKLRENDKSFLLYQMFYINRQSTLEEKQLLNNFINN